MSPLEALLEDLDVFPPERLAGRTLQRRVDTKFLCPAEALGKLILALGGGYGVLPAAGRTVARYRTLYFDSPGRRFYHQHRRGRRDRFKIRIRHYLDREVSMLEVKRKSNHGVTMKNRRPHAFGDDGLSPDDLVYLADHAPGDPHDIVSQVWTDFARITLVGLEIQERLTIDVGLEFAAGQRRHRVAGLAVVEIKQPRFDPRSAAMLALRSRGLRPARMSKYCTAQATLFPELRHNRFRPTLRTLGRLAHV